MAYVGNAPASKPLIGGSFVGNAPNAIINISTTDIVSGVFFQNDTSVSANFTVSKNSHAVGPITVADGVSLTVADGVRVVIL
jgi:hypothetical protein